MTELDEIRKRVGGIRDLADMPISMLGITGDTKAQMGADIAEAALRIATEKEAELAKLRTERDRLRAALVTVCEYEGGNSDWWINMARAALTQREGGDDGTE